MREENKLDSNNMSNNGQNFVPQQTETEMPLTVGDWMLTMLIMMIPCVNIIMVFVWAFGKSENKTKSNFFKAYLIWMVIVIIISVVMSIIFGATLATVMSSMAQY